MPITSKFVCLNGRFLKEENLCFSAENRAFRYGDGFFETMHYANGEIQFFEQHLQRMQKAMHLLKLESDILTNAKLFHKEIVHLINANHFFKGARVRLSVYRSGGGLYLPESNQAEYLIENWALENDRYPLNTKGLAIDVYSQYKKPANPDHFFKSLNTRISILAALHKKELGVDDCLLCNSEGDIIESISSNVFFIKDEQVFTSGNDSGCVHGILRSEVIKAVQKTGLQVTQDAHVKIEHLTQFDEIFICNAIQGIQWIGAYQTKRYDNKITKQIYKALIQHIFKPNP